jgi:arsenate reductase (glutaredoxin)
MYKFYHNPRCQKSRAGLENFKSVITDFEVIDYMKTGLTEEILNEILLKTNLEPIDIVRKQEELFIKELKGKSFTKVEWIKIICENPRLLQRPIIVGNHKALIANPVEKINDFIKK